MQNFDVKDYVDTCSPLPAREQINESAKGRCVCVGGGASWEVAEGEGCSSAGVTYVFAGPVSPSACRGQSLQLPSSMNRKVRGLFHPPLARASPTPPPHTNTHTASPTPGQTPIKSFLIESNPSRTPAPAPHYQPQPNPVQCNLPPYCSSLSCCGRPRPAVQQQLLRVSD